MGDGKYRGAEEGGEMGGLWSERREGGGGGAGGGGGGGRSVGCFGVPSVVPNTFRL